jgi:hypothetical protein
MCKPRAVLATVVDHRVAHRGDQKLFWDRSNWQALCLAHHNAAKQSEDRLGFSGQVDRDGWPIDPRHPVNKVR